MRTKILQHIRLSSILLRYFFHNICWKQELILHERHLHTCYNLPPAAALASPHQKLSWPPPEPLREEHFLACQQLHLSVRLQAPGAAAPQHPGF